MMKILFISRWFPYPPDNGSKIRIFNLLKQLSQRYEVDLISFASPEIGSEQRSAMLAYCGRVETVTYRPFQPSRLKALLGFFSSRPRSVIDTFNPEMQRLIDSARRSVSYHAVIASQIDMAPYVQTWPGVTKIFEELELTTPYEQFIRQSQPLKKLRYGLTWWKLTRYTANLLKNFDGCTVVSPAEHDHVRQVISGYQSIAVVPNGVDAAHYTGNFNPPQADTLIYSGALTYQANFDAVDYFLREIFPLIRSERPQVKLLITGRLDGVPIDRLPVDDHVVFTGYLPDIRPTLAGSWVNIVPLRLGGGTRLKVLESLVIGTPVVSTSKGAEGLDLIPGQELLIADTPADFAAAVLRLLSDPVLRQTLSQNGRRVVAAKYDWSIIGQQFCQFIEQSLTKEHP